MTGTHGAACRCASCGSAIAAFIARQGLGQTPARPAAHRVADPLADIRELRCLGWSLVESVPVRLPYGDLVWRTVVVNLQTGARRQDLNTDPEAGVGILVAAIKRRAAGRAVAS